MFNFLWSILVGGLSVLCVVIFVFIMDMLREYIVGPLLHKFEENFPRTFTITSSIVLVSSILFIMYALGEFLLGGM